MPIKVAMLEPILLPRFSLPCYLLLPLSYRGIEEVSRVGEQWKAHARKRTRNFIDIGGKVEKVAEVARNWRF